MFFCYVQEIFALPALLKVKLIAAIDKAKTPFRANGKVIHKCNVILVVG